MKQSISAQYCPASGAQVVDQTALQEETNSTENSWYHWCCAVVFPLASKGSDRLPWPCTLWRWTGCHSPPQSHRAAAPSCCVEVAWEREKNPRGKSFFWCKRHKAEISLVSSLRHDGSLGNKGLRCGVILDAFDSDFGPSVVAHHHICNHGTQHLTTAAETFLCFSVATKTESINIKPHHWGKNLVVWISPKSNPTSDHWLLLE